VERPAAGVVALVPFPFSDLSGAKARPVVVLAEAGRGDVILCQVTSNPYSDSTALTLMSTDFEEGMLRRVSYARPSKLFNAHRTLLRARLGTLRPEAHARLVDQIVSVLRAGLRP
jgi:mRNA interferase MazF